MLSMQAKMKFFYAWTFACKNKAKRERKCEIGHLENVVKDDIASREVNTEMKVGRKSMERQYDPQ